MYKISSLILQYTYIIPSPKTMTTWIFEFIFDTALRYVIIRREMPCRKKAPHIAAATVRLCIRSFSDFHLLYALHYTNIQRAKTLKYRRNVFIFHPTDFESESSNTQHHYVPLIYHICISVRT